MSKELSREIRKLKVRLEDYLKEEEEFVKQSMAEHEKSHLLESYGALILSLEEEFRELKS